MGERWLTGLGGAPRLGRAAGALLALAAFGQAVGQAVTLGFAKAGAGQDPGLLAFLYAFPLCALALLSTVPLLFLRPVGAAVLSVLANVIVLAVFPAPTVGGALAAVFAVWRLGADGETLHEDLERRLAQGPAITVPTITLEGDANGAPHPEPSAYAGKFLGAYEHRTIAGGIGHNLPQEAPEAFAEAVIEVGGAQ